MNNNNNKYQKGMVELIVLGAGIIAVLVVGFFFYKTFQKAQDKSAKVAQQIDQLANDTSTETTTKSAITSDLQTEIDTISLDDLNSSFKDIDSDLNSL